jgi:hypothetical protein
MKLNFQVSDAEHVLEGFLAEGDFLLELDNEASLSEVVKDCCHVQPWGCTQKWWLDGLLFENDPSLYFIFRRRGITGGRACEKNREPEFFSVAGSPLRLAARHQYLDHEGGGFKKTWLRPLQMSFAGSVVVGSHDGQLACTNGEATVREESRGRIR